MLQGIDRRENDFTNDVKDMPYEEFPEWCKLQYEYANGRLLPAGYVPQSIYWLYIDGEPVGVGKIRWKLTETSREAGGNIGYAISRQYRGHGYGTILLKSLIDIAKSGNCPELLAKQQCKELFELAQAKGTCGIGHTRWATHGEPSQTNAHPHVSGNCSRSGSGAVESEVVGVHNGIIENYTGGKKGQAPLING